MRGIQRVIRKVISDTILTTKQAADFLKVAERTMKRWRLVGDGPTFLRYGERMIRYKKAALEAFLEGKDYRSTSEYPT